MVVPGLGFHGGVERHAHDLSRALAARGHRITLLHGPTAGRDPEAYALPFARVAPLSSRDAGRGLDVVYVHAPADVAELATLEGLPVAIAAHDHDLTCARSHRYLPVSGEPCHRAPGMACVLHGCVVVRDRAPDAPLPITLRSPFALRRRLQALARRGLLVACSRYVAVRLLDAGVAPQRVRTHHPVPPDDGAPPRPRPRAPRLLAVGQLLRGKGFDLAIDALQHLPAAVTLTLVGDGPSRAALQARADRLAPGRVRLLGYVPPHALTAVYDEARVVVVPSRWPEPFGMIGVEAMRRGRPVVGAAHGGIPEWLEEGAGGRLFAPGDAAALAAAAQALLGDDDAGERARAFVARRFSHEAAVTEVETLLGEVAGASRIETPSRIGTAGRRVVAI